MTWAGQRRFVIGGILLVLAAALIAVTVIATVYKTPTCSDNIQNQGEQGVDCGGPCAKLCSSQVSQPVVRFTQAVVAGPGRTDVIAYIDNPNVSAAARGVKYDITLYDTSHVIAATGISGTIDLPPGASVPIFVPNVPVKVPIAAAFTALDTSAAAWRTGPDTRLLPSVGSPVIAGTPTAPRITVSLGNSSVTPMENVRVIATVFDVTGNVIAATQTVVPTIPAQGSAIASFNWMQPFSAAVGRIDVVPLIPLAP